MKNYLGECGLKVTCPDGECSDILVLNPAHNEELIICYVPGGGGGMVFSEAG